jgi:phage baseplate assembly protein W
MSKNKVYSDFDITFGMNPNTGDISRKFDVEAIKFAVKNLVLTNHFERPFHSEIGSNVSGSMFELMTPLTSIVLREDISLLLATFEPRISVSDIIVDPLPEKNTLKLTILFYVVNSDTLLSVDVMIGRTR